MELPKRKQIRLKEYDYSQNGYYFVTICAKDRKCLFGTIDMVDKQTPLVGADTIRPQLNEYGKYIEKSISEINNHYENVFVDKYVIMPNHIHMILVIRNDTNNRNTVSGRIVSAPTISVIVGQMKRWVSKMIGFSCWQKSFYEHIIRNELEYLKIYEYIENNPIKWKEDEYYG